MNYGVDVAITRADELDKQQLEYVKGLTNPLVLDVGCGQGGQSVRLATAGARVTGVDVGEYEQVFAEYRAAHQFTEAQLRFVQADISPFLTHYTGEQFASVTFQRTLHYLPYLEALAVLKRLRAVTTGPLYLSVTGCASAIGEAHSKRHEAIENRFGILATDAQDMFSITAPLLIYTMDEVTALLHEAGWGLCWSRTSDFGNHMLVAR